jgi:AcrR family transcriptional regulator
MTESAPTPRRSDRTRAAILHAARERFATEGYERTTIRAVAAEAGIDPSMVMRYYGSKERLFAAAADFDLRLPDPATLAPDGLGAALVGHFIGRWDADGTLTALLRAAVTHPAAAERMRQIFAEQLIPMARRLAAARGESGADAPERAGLVSSQILGLALSRYVLQLPPIATAEPAWLATWVGPTIHRYLTAPQS